MAGISLFPDYTPFVSKTIINIEETIGKSVGRRRPPVDPMLVAHSTAVRAKAWNEVFPALMPARGVYRFQSHEEADLWLTNQRIAAKRRRNR